MKTFNNILDSGLGIHHGQQIPRPAYIIFLLVAAILVGLSAGLALIALCSSIYGVDFQQALGAMGKGNTDPWLPTFMRFMIGVNHLTMFVLPAFAVLHVAFGQQKWQSVGMQRVPRPSKLVLGTLFMLFMFPIAQYAILLNKQIPMPEWMHNMESSINDSIAMLLTVSNPFALLMNVLVIAAIPALGEELVFRGILQGQLSRKIGPIAAIWVGAIIFSAFHMQFEGFLARVVLGAALGYLYYWTGSLWTPIIAHFLNNALQVVAAAMMGEAFNDLDVKSTDTLPWYVLLACISAAVGLGAIIRQSDISVLSESDTNA